MAPLRIPIRVARGEEEDELARRMMIQREISMAVNIAEARYTIWIFGSAWATLIVGTGTAKATGRNVPLILGVPVVIGVLVLGNHGRHGESSRQGGRIHFRLRTWAPGSLQPGILS